MVVFKTALCPNARGDRGGDREGNEEEGVKNYFVARLICMIRFQDTESERPVYVENFFDLKCLRGGEVIDR